MDAAHMYRALRSATRETSLKSFGMSHVFDVSHSIVVAVVTVRHLSTW